MTLAEQLLAVAGSALAAFLTGGGLVKWLNRRADNALATATEVDTLRKVIEEVREDAGLLRAENVELRGRVEVLEERERHQLARAAVHEAWDQMSFALLVALHPNHPPPPPLTPGHEAGHDEGGP